MAGVEAVFCSVQSLAVGDPLAGTGAHARRNLLISWPSGKWMRSLRRASDMSEALIERIEAVVAEGRRVNLIHRQQQPADCHRLYLMPENLQLEVEREQLAAVLDALLNDAPLDPWNACEAPKPLILCCTHGKKDKCCAKFGNATYRSLVKAVAESGDTFEVWQSSHLGGCRLAASTMVFPSTRKYGRIGEADIMPLLHAEAHNRPYLPCYRGDSALAPVEQTAEVAALQWLAEREINARVEVDRVEHQAIGDVETGAGGNTGATVWLNWQDGDEQGRLAVTCAMSELHRFDTCADISPDGPAVSSVWGVQAIEPVSC